MEIEYSNFAIDPNVYGKNELCGLIDTNSNYIYNNFYDIKKLTYNPNVTVNRFLNSLIPSEPKKIVEQAIKEFEFDSSFMKKKLRELSSSELIKVLSIKLLISDAKVIILDHIDTFMSSKDLNQLLKFIRSFLKDTNKSVIFSANRIDNIIPQCTRYLIARDNQLIYNGNDINKLPEKTEIMDFVVMANKKKANLDNYKDINDLLKAVYRSVKK